MAYFRKLPSGRHRAEIELLGVRDSDSFATKTEARAWAARREEEIRAGTGGQFPSRTFIEAIDKYLKEVSESKPGARWEAARFEAFKRDNAELAAMVFHEVDTPHMAAWRDRRLKKVTKGTVQREINLLSNLFHVAEDEWKWRGGTPFKGMKQPGDNPPRRRRTLWTEVKAICRWLGYRTGEVETKQQEVAFAYLVALRTSMRSQEILQLGDATVDYRARTATIARHKTGHKTGEPKVVPLLPPALRLLGYVRGRGAYFTVDATSRDALFRKARDALLIQDLTFHDAKAEILTRLAKKVDILTLSKISGNKDLRILRDTYYRETESEVAHRVAGTLRSSGRSASGST
jgi:integrase